MQGMTLLALSGIRMPRASSSGFGTLVISQKPHRHSSPLEGNESFGLHKQFKLIFAEEENGFAKKQRCKQEAAMTAKALA